MICTAMILCMYIYLYIYILTETECPDSHNVGHEKPQKATTTISMVTMVTTFRLNGHK